MAATCCGLTAHFDVEHFQTLVSGAILYNINTKVEKLTDFFITGVHRAL